jgi:GTP:adenosylcobinamide-phosphate guanylyltransferase
MIELEEIKKDLSMHIIVQAGGRGSRLRHHTWNKPKCLVSVNGRPLLYQLFDRFPNCFFHIIGDYAYDQLENYLKVNQPHVSYNLIRATGKGTLAGMQQALSAVPEHSSLLIVWSDLVIGELPQLPTSNLPVVILTRAFNCRWVYQTDHTLQEKPGSLGVPGIFYFNQVKDFPMPPAEGEFVAWFADNIKEFVTVVSDNLCEVGEFKTIEDSNHSGNFSRFFNKIEINKDRVIKTTRLPEYQWLIDCEKQWYRDVESLGFHKIPKIYNSDPLIMEHVPGKHAYDLQDLTNREKRSVLADYIDSLDALHRLGSKPAVEEDLRQVYIEKTKQRINGVKNLIPKFQDLNVTINGVKCRNLFAEDRLDDLLKFVITEKFTPIHGDPTFSNSLVDHNLKVRFIDPRGYFHQPGIWGDPWYDFAKLYYSARGGFDTFNRRQFKLYIDEQTVEILQQEPLFADVADSVFKEFFGKNFFRIQILQGLIWLSFGGYAKDDIDSVIGSFYLGLYWLEQASQ